MTGISAYTSLDRLLHEIAFHTNMAQKALADVEEVLFAKRINGIAILKPVFITALPRAGTTILLEILSTLEDFASHTYRDMPFVLCPLLWEGISKKFRQRATLKERAHGDGIAIGYDSPEAFEEIVWASHWRKKYLPDRIEPWTKTDRDGDFEKFIDAHMRKIIALRTSHGGGNRSKRYLSKNNANIARLGLLSALYPDGIFIIPIRNPMDHASSLLQQHQRFSKIHAEDKFARRYMRALGHFEFGNLLRPMNFQNWMEEGRSLDTNQISFWLTYWIAAFESILATTRPNLFFVDYDRICRQPEAQLDALASVLDLQDTSALIAQAFRYRAANFQEHLEEVDASLKLRALDVYKTLQARAL